MLTRLRLKNWRSVKEETIHFTTPITVFIGANSSGKTNIVDALYFLRESSEDGVRQAVINRGGAEKVHSIDSELDDPLEIGFSFNNPLFETDTELTYILSIFFSHFNKIIPEVGEQLKDEQSIWLDAISNDRVQVRISRQEDLRFLPDPPFGWEQTVLASLGDAPSYPALYYTHQFITRRWQLLDENFMPPLSVASRSYGDVTMVDRCADNVPNMLDYFRSVKPQIYDQLQEDLAWLLPHIETLKTLSNERETRIEIYEKNHLDREAPTISAGSARLIAILAAYYGLDFIQRPEFPGLVVIEEADTALNPGLLQKFVGQLRNYTEREGQARQFILTTHNPAFLDFFEPEEVRVVERDDQGYTHVRHIPDYIKDIWLDKYALGEVWTTNSFGGLPK
ncbi:MAG: AAA family ATPase [Chloroflexi bacterium]|nr:AAA family ATPase [Chloroflexota bacterium]